MLSAVSRSRMSPNLIDRACARPRRSQVARAPRLRRSKLARISQAPARYYSFSYEVLAHRREELIEELRIRGTEFDISTTTTAIRRRRGAMAHPYSRCASAKAISCGTAGRPARRAVHRGRHRRPGFGDSGTPPSTPDHRPYSMREIVLDQMAVLQALGHDRFSVVGHDRRARSTYGASPRAVRSVAVAGTR